MLKFTKTIPSAVAVVLAALFMPPDVLAQKAPAPETQKPSATGQINRIDGGQRPVAKPAARQATRKKKKTSVCQYLAKTDCEGKAECGWIMPKKKVDKRGRNLLAYCRKTARASKRKINARQVTKINK